MLTFEALVSLGAGFAGGRGDGAVGIQEDGVFAAELSGVMAGSVSTAARPTHDPAGTKASMPAPVSASVPVPGVAGIGTLYGAGEGAELRLAGALLCADAAAQGEAVSEGLAALVMRAAVRTDADASDGLGETVTADGASGEAVGEEAGLTMVSLETAAEMPPPVDPALVVTSTLGGSDGAAVSGGGTQTAAVTSGASTSGAASSSAAPGTPLPAEPAGAEIPTFFPRPTTGGQRPVADSTSPSTGGASGDVPAVGTGVGGTLGAGPASAAMTATAAPSIATNDVPDGLSAAGIGVSGPNGEVVPGRADTGAGVQPNPGQAPVLTAASMAAAGGEPALAPRGVGQPASSAPGQAPAAGPAIPVTPRIPTGGQASESAAALLKAVEGDEAIVSLRATHAAAGRPAASAPAIAAPQAQTSLGQDAALAGAAATRAAAGGVPGAPGGDAPAVSSEDGLLEAEGEAPPVRREASGTTRETGAPQAMRVAAGEPRMAGLSGRTDGTVLASDPDMSVEPDLVADGEPVPAKPGAPATRPQTAAGVPPAPVAASAIAATQPSVEPALMAEGFDEAGELIRDLSLGSAGRGSEAQAGRPAQQAAGQQATLPTAMMAMEIARQAQRGSTRFEIRLDPPELGRVDVHLKIGDDGKVQAHLIVERRDTLDMFMRDQRGMERALENAGLKSNPDGGLQFSLKDQGQGQRFAGQEGRQGASGHPAASQSEAEGDTVQPQGLERLAAYARDGARGIDIRV